MKYIFYNDSLNFIRNNTKVIIGYFIFIVGMFFLEHFLGYDYDLELFSNIVGLNFNLEGNYLTIFTYLFNIMFFLYLSNSLFTSDLKTNLGNLFLRIKKGHYIIYKMISITFITFLIKGLIYLFIEFLYFIHGVGIESIGILFLKDFFLISILQYLGILLYIVGKKMMKFVLLIFFILILLLGKKMDVDDFSLIWLCVIFLMLIPIIKIIFRKFCTLLFE